MLTHASVVSLQVSTVQATPSLQLIGVPAAQVPATQCSTPSQNAPLLHCASVVQFCCGTNARSSTSSTTKPAKVLTALSMVSKPKRIATVAGAGADPNRELMSMSADCHSPVPSCICCTVPPLLPATITNGPPFTDT